MKSGAITNFNQPHDHAGPDWALLFLVIVIIGEIVGVIKILFD
jgi:hypothetical protein